ncbi:MAG: hypothetical protein JRH15_07340 [Deltaproteobacteria bacterium]|nr:hypothetical protein [Deltaproteobacteria bacterium]
MSTGCATAAELMGLTAASFLVAGNIEKIQPRRFALFAAAIIVTGNTASGFLSHAGL